MLFKTVIAVYREAVEGRISKPGVAVRYELLPIFRFSASRNTSVSRGALTVPSPLFLAFGKKAEG